MKFRKLKAEEIDVRVGSTKSPKGTSLLLYKDARCDMNILDETVGALNWQRSHSRDNANCTVSIYDKDKGLWVSKEDTGTESFTEKEKGLASDSFKRACFNWGIGRELYTGGFIFIPANVIDKDSIKYANFEVSKITYDDNGNIEELEISSGGKIVFVKKHEVKENLRTEFQIRELLQRYTKEELAEFSKGLGRKSDKWTYEEAQNLINAKHLRNEKQKS